jgi:hypothetical protein
LDSKEFSGNLFGQHTPSFLPDIKIGESMNVKVSFKDDDFESSDEETDPDNEKPQKNDDSSENCSISSKKSLPPRLTTKTQSFSYSIQE